MVPSKSLDATILNENFIESYDWIMDLYDMNLCTIEIRTRNTPMLNKTLTRIS